MLKHATVTRNSRTAFLWEPQATTSNSPDSPASQRTPSPPPQSLISSVASSGGIRNNSFSQTASLMASIRRNCAIGGSLPSSPAKPPAPTAASESIIKVFAQTLGQEVEYVTLHVNAQTKSQQIVKSLLRKFRLKHRDPNLFYLTLERQIRKDGLRCKQTTLLGDEACPMQYQQCCSNPPYNDIKFTLQSRTGALVKIFCSDVAPETRYKCLSLSTQTTVEETIELMLHCLNLISPQQASTTCSTASQTAMPQCRQSAGSPSSTGSSNSSTTSSSSGIDSDLPAKQSIAFCPNQQLPLSSNSRTSSTTSISSASTFASSSATNNMVDQFCLIIECKDSNFRRILERDEYLVNVYQSLLAEAKEQQEAEERRLGNLDLLLGGETSNRQSAEQWFFIKLKRRHDISHHPNAISLFASARQSMPLPPLPSAISQLMASKTSSSEMLERGIVSTTQIDTASRRRPASSLAATSNAPMCRPLLPPKPIDLTSNDNFGARLRNPPPPAVFVLPPMARPRRRNLSNASSTFMSNVPLAQPARLTTASSFNRHRRYDPAQLEADLSRLNMSDRQNGPPINERESVVIDQSVGEHHDNQ